MPGPSHLPHPGAPLRPGVVELPRPSRGLAAFLDVAGGLCFALFVSLLCITIANKAFVGVGWAYAIGWESVWAVAAIACSPLMPSGVQHEVSWRTTLEGIKLDWPEFLLATLYLGAFGAYIGGVQWHWGAFGLALSVGAAEELIFRVLLLGWLITRMETVPALMLSSVVFGLAHIDEASAAGILAILPQTAGGVMLGAVYLRTRNPLGPIIAHAYWDYPFFMVMGAGVGFGPGGAQGPGLVSTLPWVIFIIYGLWLVRDGVECAGRTRALVPATSRP